VRNGIRIGSTLLLLIFVALSFRDASTPPSTTAGDDSAASSGAALPLSQASREPGSQEPDLSSSARPAPSGDLAIGALATPSAAPSGAPTAPSAAAPPGADSPPPRTRPARRSIGVISGVVLGADGEPLAGARLGYIDRADPVRRGGAAVSDAEGRFRIAAPADSSGELVVSHRDHRELSLPGVRPGDGPLSIALEEGAGIDGIATAAGEPIADAMILLRGPGGERRARTGEQGEFRIRGLGAGEYLLTVAGVSVTAGEDSGEAEAMAVPAHEPVAVAIDDGQIIESEFVFELDEAAGPR
jgi:hypothetical protein